MLELKEKQGLQNNEQLWQTNVHFEKGRMYGIATQSKADVDKFVEVLLGLKKFENIHILFDHKDLEEINKNDYRKKVGCSFREDTLIDNYSAVENVMLAMEISDIQEKHKQLFASALLQRYGIDEAQGKTKVSKLELAQRKIVEIVRVLAKDPDLIIVDNLLSEKDSPQIIQFLEELKQLSIMKNKCVILLDDNPKLDEYTDELWGLSNCRLHYIKTSQ